MVHATKNLPGDIEALQRLVLAQQSQIALLQERVQTRDAESLYLRTWIEKLKLEIARLKRMQFGRSSEQTQARIDQLELIVEDLEATQAQRRPAEPSANGKTEQPGPSRQALPAHLPREEVRHEPKATSCPDCGGDLRQLGEDIAEMLEYVPASFRVIRHVRPKLTCRCCERIVQEPAPSRPIDRGIPGPGLLAQVLVAKFADHVPLNRQSGIYEREGVSLERSTLADWVGSAARLLQPLTDAIGEHVLAGDKVHADDTPVSVLQPGRGTTKTGRLWTYVRDDRPCGHHLPPAVWFRYSPDRKGEHPQRHLKDFRGILQADGYAGYEALYADGRVTEAACWAHVRRKFHDIAQATGSPIATEAINRIGALYGIEKQINGRPAEERRRERQARAGPLLQELHQWLQATLSTVSNKGEPATAIKYALTRWSALTRYADDGRIEIDNNAAERSIRPIALGRKNWLFAGSDAGGKRAAAISSLIGTAKLNGLDPWRYLHHVLDRIAGHPINRIGELLPWNVDIVPASTSH
ncbi:MAG: IS66 family transposase [Alphaproteobacteria bacterium]|jgi:transposase